MEWFKRSKTGIDTAEKRDVPDHLWIKCENCKEIVYRNDWEDNLHVCPSCGHHHRFSARGYVKLLLDADTFVERDRELAPADPLGFSAKKKYRDSLVLAQRTTGEKSGVVAGDGRLDDIPVSIAVMDFRFLGGSMGSTEGEKIARTLQRSAETGAPAIVISASGGARMHEGTFSLMQMAKTSGWIAILREKRIPYVSILTNPTTGGVTASFAMLGDINIAEPGTVIGFAGERVIRETIRQALPDGFQRSEFLLKHGFLDFVVERKDMKRRVGCVLRHLLEPGYPAR